MLYRKVPRNGDELSILGFGAMRLPTKNMRIDKERAKAQIYSAIDSGVNYIDTAYIYHVGNSERFLGEILPGKYRDKVFLATKLPTWLCRKTEDFDRFLGEQLSRLQTDHIDYYLLHSLSSKKGYDALVDLGVIPFLERAKAEGKIRNIGFSFHGGFEDFKAIIDAYDWTFVQIQFNFYDEHNQAGIEGLNYAAERDLAVFIMEPLRGGSLAGEIPPQVRKIWDRSGTGWTPAQWALRWVWNHKGVTLLLSGMNEEAHIAQNLAAAADAYEGAMTADELGLVEEVKREYQRMIKVPCTACRYCMPCPAGVDIPTCFEIYNQKYMFPKKRSGWNYVQRLGGTSGEKPAMASQCVSCGRCESHCPQHIEIRKELRQVRQEMEGFSTKVMLTGMKLLRK